MELKSTYNCIVIDDEKLARELIEDLLKSYPNFNLIGKYKNTSLALNTLNSNFDVDVIFLDIQMPGETGIEFLKANKIKPKVILTTAYSEYALDGFNFEVVDYLLKPITETRFNQTMIRLKKVLETEIKAQAFELIEINNKNYLHIKSGASEHRIYFNELLRMEAYGEYIRYITCTQEFLVLGSLKKILAILPSNFIQVHRSHILSIKEIKGREKYTLIMNDFKEIPIGKTYRKDVLKALSF